MPAKPEAAATEAKEAAAKETEKAKTLDAGSGVAAAGIVALFAIVAFFVLQPDAEASPSKSSGIRVVSEEEMSLHDGETDSTIWLAVLGEVYDVSVGEKYYGKGQGYAGFAGRDASAAFVSGDFTEKGLTDSVSDFNLEQIGGVDHWRKFYRDSKVYHKIGVLDGTYFDSTGEPTAARKEAMAKIEEGQKQQDALTAQKKKYPSCNMKWAQNEGGKVWCEDETKFPRKVSEGNFKLEGYPDCPEKALQCKTP